MRPRATLALANFLSVGHFYLVTYILGPYLGTLLPDAFVGLVIAAGAVATLTLFPHVPRVLARIGAQNFALAVGFIQALFLFGLVVAPGPLTAIALIALACALSPFIAYALDILLEATMRSEAGTGKVRTAFLTAGNVPLLLAPVFIALLLDSGNEYARVFFAASASLLPFLILMSLVRLPQGAPQPVHRLRDTFACVRGNPDVVATLGANYLLQIFYHLAPLYISLYLHNVLGIPWETLGWMFAVMLVPFVLIEYPAGAIGDRKGDRHLLALGFITMGASFAMIALLTPATPLFAILLVLIASRVGAALVEAMTEGHFFRHVSEQDVTTVELFRMMRPIAALTAPLVGSAILYFGGYAALFLSTGLFIAIAGLYAALRVRDACRPQASSARSGLEPARL